MHIAMYKNAMLIGNVTTTGNNVGGLIGYIHTYNRTTTSYIQNSYINIENSFATRWRKRKL